MRGSSLRFGCTKWCRNDGHSRIVPGDGSTVNVGHFSFRSGDYETSFAASMRAIYDLSDLQNSRFVLAPGQAGHRLSPHYDDLLPRWAAGDYIPMRTNRNRLLVERGTRRLLLVPK